ncbi:hypothetical protein JZ751_008821 [Albula glossodonta]|uniref:Uncharacterized protein n=1 Tax=Albula glossodonta TaxID=121402 RepID=A0A8T2PAF9_9TELE|nr:hypothetical protein JZ751_008821 [Albula glossodonta]
MCNEVTTDCVIPVGLDLVLISGWRLWCHRVTDSWCHPVGCGYGVTVSQTPGVIQWVGDDRTVDEEEEGQVGQEIEQVQGADVTELPLDDLLVLRPDPARPQLH